MSQILAPVVLIEFCICRDLERRPFRQVEAVFDRLKSTRGT